MGADFGVVDCGRGNGRARTVWKNLKQHMPDPKLFKEGIKWEICKMDPTLEHMQRRLSAEWAQSENADVRRHALEAASLVRASLHQSLGHSFQPRDLLGDERL